MDALNKFMEDKGFPEDLRGRLRTFFNNAKELSKNQGYKELTERLSPKLRSDVTEKAASWMLKLEYFVGHDIDIGCVVELSHHLVGSIYEQTEPIPWANGLFCCSKGVASRAGHVRTAGAFWGDDFILNSDTLKDKQNAYALTFVEVLFMERVYFDEVLEEWPVEKALVRKACVNMAVRRGILFAAKVIAPIRAHHTAIEWEELQPTLERELYRKKARVSDMEKLVNRAHKSEENEEFLTKTVAELSDQMDTMHTNMNLIMRALNVKPVKPRKPVAQSTQSRALGAVPVTTFHSALPPINQKRPIGGPIGGASMAMPNLHASDEDDGSLE
jgi:hypothetical protein